jgi:hypothetical protein
MLGNCWLGVESDAREQGHDRRWWRSRILRQREHGGEHRVDGQRADVLLRCACESDLAEDRLGRQVQVRTTRDLKFEQPGTYKFESSTLFDGGPSLNYAQYEIVVESATGTTPTTTPTTITPTTTTTTPSEPGHGYGSPLEGGSRALELAGSQRGSTVHGSIKVSQAGSGGRLEVGLFAASASLVNAGHSAQVRVGRSMRSLIEAGSVSFSVPLSARGKAALRCHRRLALTVKIVLTPPRGATATLASRVVLRA